MSAARGGDRPLPALGPRPPWSVWRERLAAAGFRPSRRLGQNFLVDESACRRIARTAGDLAGVRVLEVGMGLGFLTRHVVAGGAHVLACEIDPRLAELAEAQLEHELDGATGTLEVWVGDVLAGKHRLAPELDARLGAEASWRLVSNLPYSVASPLLAVLALHPRPPRSATVLVQQEVAERLCAAPGNRAYGALSVVVQGAFDARLEFEVGPRAFRPRPKVSSAVASLTLRADLQSPARRARLAELARALFTERRKRLRAPLARYLAARPGKEGGTPLERADRLLVAAGIDTEARVEDLGREGFERLEGQVARAGGAEQL